MRCGYCVCIPSVFDVCMVLCGVGDGVYVVWIWYCIGMGNTFVLFVFIYFPKQFVFIF